MNWLAHARRHFPSYFDERSRELIEATGDPTCQGRVITWPTLHGAHRFYVMDDGHPSFVRAGNEVILYGQKRSVEIDPVDGRILRTIKEWR